METLEQLNAYGIGDFEAWLDARLRAQYSADSGTRFRSFDFRDLGVPFGDSHIDQLVALFGKLSVPGRANFRGALEQLLRHAEPGDFPFEGMSDLVYVVGLVKAYQALSAFVPVLGSGPWGELHRSLIYDALSVLLMFDRTVEAYDAAKGLGTSANFSDAYVFDAYLVLVRSRPQNWSSDLGLLRERFSSVRRRILGSGDSKLIEQLARRERDLATSLAQAVPVYEIGRQLATLQFAEADARDAWLIDNLLGQSAALRLEYETAGNSLCLIDQSTGTRNAAVVSTPELEVFCISRGYLFDHWTISHDLSAKTQKRLSNLTQSAVAGKTR